MPDMEIKDPKLELIVNSLAAALHPKKMYLFGSRARGNYRSDSDYDIALIVGDDLSDKGKRREMAYEALKGVGARVDFFIYTQAEFDEWKDELSSIPETALHEGLELSFG